LREAPLHNVSPCFDNCNYVDITLLARDSNWSDVKMSAILQSHSTYDYLSMSEIWKAQVQVYVIRSFTSSSEACCNFMYTSILCSLCTYLLPFLRSSQLCSHSRTSQHFMEPEGLITCSQEPSTGPYYEPQQSNPHDPILSF
jgi:hypothetical protein